MPADHPKPTWLVDLGNLAHALEHGLPLPPRDGERQRPKLTLIRGGAPASGKGAPAHQGDRRPLTQRSLTIIPAVPLDVEDAPDA